MTRDEARAREVIRAYADPAGPDLEAAIAAALTNARREGREEAAKRCEAMADAGDPVMLAERVEALRLAAARIRALPDTDGDTK